VFVLEALPPRESPPRNRNYAAPKRHKSIIVWECREVLTATPPPHVAALHQTL
jgi:hypothetical protein